MAQAPLRTCAECGRPLGRRWREFQLCDACKAEAVSARGWTRRARFTPDELGSDTCGCMRNVEAEARRQDVLDRLP